MDLATQLWDATVSPRSDSASGCSTYSLPADGVLTLASGETITLTSDAVFRAACSAASTVSTAAHLVRPAILGDVSLDQTSSASTSDPQFSDFRDPFYASTFPQCYALAATTIISYTLCIMLFIAPRSFLDGGVVVLGRRGFTNGPSNGISVGGRPWLQKVAALTVAISLTIATAETFRVAEVQYAEGIENAPALQNEVLNGTQLKVIRLISDTFLWLAQAQTLIRLFPRQREKVIIKWTAFSLITLDVIFGALNSFLYDGAENARPRNFTDAVPALSYLFQLSLGLLYAAWVIYYSFMKKRFAYYHPLMKNIGLVATLSIVSLLVPVVFFILDISKPDFTGWGDYVRWVGAAAASVIVWEWVERIEALEREEKKDGILGREVFDGDEMIDASGTDFVWPRRRRTKKKGDDDGGEGGNGAGERNPSSSGPSNMWPAMSSIASRYMPRSGGGSAGAPENGGATTAGKSAARFIQPPLWISRPPPAVTPISRTETASADSTVYAVRYQPFTDSTSRTTGDDQRGRALSRENSLSSDGSRNPSPTPSAPKDVSSQPAVEVASKEGAKPHGWRSILKLRGGDNAPPAEVLPHTQKVETTRREYESMGWWDMRGRLEDFAATQADKIREKLRPTPDTESLEVVVIPPPPRRGAALAQVLEEEALEAASGPERSAVFTPPSSSITRTLSNPSAMTGFTPLMNRNNSLASNSSRPTPNPTQQRGEALQIRTPRQDSFVSSASPTTPAGNGSGERTTPASPVSPVSPVSPSAPRRPVDDILQDGPTPP